MDKSILFKQPAEVLWFAMDFTKRLDDGDTIYAANVSTSRVDGEDSDLVTADVTNNDPFVEVLISGGTSSVLYKVTFTISTLGGEVKEEDGYLQVVDE